MKGSFTKSGYTFKSKMFGNFIDIFFDGIPYPRINGVKGMLDFFEVTSAGELDRFINDNCVLEFKNEYLSDRLLNALTSRISSEAFKVDIADFLKRNDLNKENSIQKLAELNDYIKSTDDIADLSSIIVDTLGITSVPVLKLNVSLAVFCELTLNSNESYLRSALLGMAEYENYRRTGKKSGRVNYSKPSHDWISRFKDNNYLFMDIANCNSNRELKDSKLDSYLNTFITDQDSLRVINDFKLLLFLSDLGTWDKYQSKVGLDNLLDISKYIVNHNAKLD